MVRIAVAKDLGIEDPLTLILLRQYRKLQVFEPLDLQTSSMKVMGQKLQGEIARRNADDSTLDKVSHVAAIQASYRAAERSMRRMTWRLKKIRAHA